MSIWGWQPKLYVLTGVIPATRDSISHYVVSGGPYQSYFRSRYLGDLAKSRPPIFVDTIANGAWLWHSWSDKDAHESFPELDKFINENYVLWADNTRLSRAPARIYVLKERFAALKEAGLTAPGKI